MTIQSTPPIQKNPVDILQEQVMRLTDIYQAQQEQLGLLRSQNEHLNQALQVITKPTHPSGLTHVKIEDINMPFWALVGFLLKLTFAWIPAMIVFGILYFVIVLIFGGFLSAFLH